MYVETIACRRRRRLGCFLFRGKEDGISTFVGIAFSRGLFFPQVPDNDTVLRTHSLYICNRISGDTFLNDPQCTIEQMISSGSSRESVLSLPRLDFLLVHPLLSLALPFRPPAGQTVRWISEILCGCSPVVLSKNAITYGGRPSTASPSLYLSPLL